MRTLVSCEAIISLKNQNSLEAAPVSRAYDVSFPSFRR